MSGRNDIPSGYKEDWQWQEGDLTVTRTTHYSAPGCHDGCQVLMYTDKDGKLVDIEGDPHGPYNKGRLCMRCLNLVETYDHPDRIKHPMKRIGPRGSNEWEEISWEEALDIFKTRWDEITAKYGKQSVGALAGTGRNTLLQGGWFTNKGLGTFMGSSGFLSGDSCYHPRLMAMNAIQGGACIADCAQLYEDGFDDPRWERPEVCVVWGNNPLKSNSDGFYGHWMVDLLKQGTKLIVIDPNIIWLASRAEVVLQVRPGTDAALAMAMLHVIINEDLYDHEFVENWCYGFKPLANRVKDCTPQWAAEICGLDAEDIVRAARLYATAKNASIQWGVTLDMSRNSGFAAMAVIDLWAITGNVEIPGGNVFVGPYPDIRSVYRPGAPQGGSIVPTKRADAPVPGYAEFPLRKFAHMPGSPDIVLEQLETGEPWPLKMMYACGTNSIANIAAEAPRVYEAIINSVEFFVVSDCFITPTITAFADLVLPIGMSGERNSVRAWWAPIRTMSQVVDPGDTVGDDELLLRLGKKFNPEEFPFGSDIDLLNEVISHLPEIDGEKLTFEDLEKRVYVYSPWDYLKHEKGLLRPDGQPGFNTPTGKIELYASTYEACGIEPLPYYEEPSESPVSTPELVEEFPLVLTTGQRAYEFFHSEHRQLPTMREFHKWPLLEINPKDACEYGIEDGSWCWVQNVHGKAKLVAHYNKGMKEGVVAGEHGWWFPEREGSEEGGFFGVFESNINNLTTMCDVGDTGCGAPYRAQICRVYPVTPENEKYEVTPEEHDRSVAARKHIRK